jgi:NADPH oxidase 2
MINLNCGVLLFTVCRNLVSALRSSVLKRYIPFDKNISFHILVAFSIVFWSSIHVIAHYFNFVNIARVVSVEPEGLSFGSGPGWTGLVVVVCLFLMVSVNYQNYVIDIFERSEKI